MLGGAAFLEETYQGFSRDPLIHSSCQYHHMLNFLQLSIHNCFFLADRARSFKNFEFPSFCWSWITLNDLQCVQIRTCSSKTESIWTYHIMNSSLMWQYFIVNVTCSIYLEILFAEFGQFQTNLRWVLLGHCFLLPQLHLFEVIYLICCMQDHWFRHSERASCPTLYQDLSWLRLHIKALAWNQWLLSFTRNGCFGSLTAFEADQDRLH